MVKLFYMNQGSQGNYGALRYSEYDALFLCESTDRPKTGFSYLIQTTDSKPAMTIQVADGSGRLLTSAKDVSPTAKSTRPLLRTTLGDVEIFFVHLKSASVTLATDEAKQAVNSVDSQSYPTKKRLWLGDFNRAADTVLTTLGLKEAYKGGGQANWDLDRVYVSGSWASDELPVITVETTAAGDHGHVGLAIELPKAQGRGGR